LSLRRQSVVALGPDGDGKGEGVIVVCWFRVRLLRVSLLVDCCFIREPVLAFGDVSKCFGTSFIIIIIVENGCKLVMSSAV
jgi:hypothetical protein